VRTPAIAIAAALAASCATTYRPRQAPLGDPSWPAAHVDGFSPDEADRPPDWYPGPDSENISATVTRAGGFEVKRSAKHFVTYVRWDIRLQGGDGTEVLAMMWSPPTAPRCQGGHPALDILLDLDRPPNHKLAPDRQVHWERPVVVRGERVLSGRFDEDRDLLQRASVVDLHVIQRGAGPAREVCVRVPVANAAVTYRNWN
jgi:hypothetical protein